MRCTCLALCQVLYIHYLIYSSQQTSGKANDLKMRKQIGKVSNEPKGTAQKQQVVFKVKSNTLQSLDFCGTGNYLPDADTSHRVSKARLSYSAVTDTADQPLGIRVAHGVGASVDGLQASPGHTLTWRPHRKECAGVRHQRRNTSALQNSFQTSPKDAQQFSVFIWRKLTICLISISWVLWSFPTSKLNASKRKKNHEIGVRYKILHNTVSVKISILNIHWKDWCWSWNSNTLAT